MISQTVEYALRAVVTLAYRHGEAMTGQQIAAIAKVPRPYLLKLVQQLVRAGLINSRRGRGGGFTLSRDPDEICIWDIVQVVDQLERITKCPLGVKGHTALCPLHRRMDQVIANVQQAYQSTTLAEIIADCGDSSPLCTTTPIVQISGIAAKPSTKSTAKRKTTAKLSSPKKKANRNSAKQ